MSTEKRKNLLLFAAVTLLAILLFAACGSKAATAADKIELGQKYLIELNYTEAIASFTEAIKLDPNNIQAYMGRAEAYLALGEYDKALEDYQFVCEKTEEMPYTRALSYIGQAEVYGKTDEPEKAVSDYELSKALLSASDVGKAENVSEEDVEAKMVQVLYAHAALCEILKNYNTALEDYNDLLKLGEKVDSKRGEILSQLGESIEEENGLLGTEADKVASEPNTEEPIEEKLTEEPAAEQKTSSASESQPASEETKPEEPASSSKQSQEEAASLQEEITEINWVEETVKSKYCSNSVSVRYSIGAYDHAHHCAESGCQRWFCPSDPLLHAGSHAAGLCDHRPCQGRFQEGCYLQASAAQFHDPHRHHHGNAPGFHGGLHRPDREPVRHPGSWQRDDERHQQP